MPRLEGDGVVSGFRLTRRQLVGGALVAAASAVSGRVWASSESRAPVLYLSHGAPVFAMNDPARIAELRAWGARIPKPRGIVAMTPHFGSRRLEVGATGRGVAMYNLPGRLKSRIPANLDYATPTNEALAARLDALAGTAGARRHGRRGFDHTTWMPLACLFPAADVPVVELTYPYLDDASLFRLGAKLSALRDEGVLFFATGGMTHNLASVDFDFESHPHPPPTWATDFDAWASERLGARDVDALVDWRSKAPAQALAHPDDGAHFRVLLVALGVAMGGARAATQVEFPVVGYESTLSKRSVQLT
jgi:4,5-DOPA dioxygenase extradiol